MPRVFDAYHFTLAFEHDNDYESFFDDDEGKRNEALEWLRDTQYKKTDFSRFHVLASNAEWTENDTKELKNDLKNRVLEDLIEAEFDDITIDDIEDVRFETSNFRWRVQASYEFNQDGDYDSIFYDDYEEGGNLHEELFEGLEVNYNPNESIENNKRVWVDILNFIMTKRSDIVEDVNGEEVLHKLHSLNVKSFSTHLVCNVDNIEYRLSDQFIQSLADSKSFS